MDEWVVRFDTFDSLRDMTYNVSYLENYQTYQNVPPTHRFVSSSSFSKYIQLHSQSQYFEEGIYLKLRHFDLIFLHCQQTAT